jgi:hypothetical protein
MSDRNRTLRETLVGVIVGGLIASLTSVIVLHYTLESQLKETLRKEQAEHVERVATLGARLLRDFNSSIALGILRRHQGMLAEDIHIAAAPSDTLVELDAVVRLYLPGLQKDVDAIREAFDQFVSRADAMGAQEFSSTDTSKDDQLATFVAYKKRMEGLGEPVVERTLQLLKDLRKWTPTSNHAMERTADHGTLHF